METKGHARLLSERVLWLPGKTALTDVRNIGKITLNKQIGFLRCISIKVF